MQLISLVGFKGSGKDSAGRHLVERHGFTSFSFAESLKDALASIFCWDRSMLEGDTPESREWRETVDVWWSERLGIPNFTPRLAMQLVGTNVFRQHFNTDVWILNIERKLSLLPQDAKVVLIDGRFPNELNLGRKYGAKVIRVRRGDEPEWFDEAAWINANVSPIYSEEWQRRFEDLNAIVHVSEWAWIGERIDETIENNDTMDHLYQRIAALSAQPIATIQRVMPTVIAHDIVGVSPLTAPSPDIFKLRQQYRDNL